MKRHYHTLAVVAGLTGVLMSCRESPTAPNPLAPLELIARVSKETVAVGDTATMEFVLHNPTSRVIRVNTSCGVIQRFVFQGSTLILQGPTSCTKQLIFTDIAPNGDYIERLPFRGRPEFEPAIHAGLGLVAGRYSAYAAVIDFRSNSVRFEVVQ